ncbi:MAG: GIY-YIG nuclease family protein [Candidatus Moraniibacteriota bacterium]|jgi:putative endonuclease|nr:MAG: GIY-YIG nuclease family protein [Candidatus Moranbacteria bacterium]
MYYVYVLQSLKDQKLYIGYTNNLKRRFQEHNTGRNEVTKERKPFILLYYEACNQKGDALKRELQLKTGFGRQYLKRRISDLR